MNRDQAAKLLADVLDEEERDRWEIAELDPESSKTNVWYAAQIVTVLYRRGFEIAKPPAVREKRPTPAQRIVLVQCFERGGILPERVWRACIPSTISTMVQRGWLSTHGSEYAVTQAGRAAYPWPTPNQKAPDVG